MKNPLRMYVSQWEQKCGAPGLSLFHFDTETGALEKVKTLDEEKSFGCSYIDPVKNVMYICNEGNLFPQTPYDTGRVYCYKLDPASGEIALLNYKDTYCPFTSYVNVDETGRYLMVSNHTWTTYTTTVEQDETGAFVPVTHTNDSVCNLFALNEDGSLGEMVDVAKHPAAPGIRFTLEGRVRTPHPHCVMKSPSGKVFAVCDKGDGHVYLYGIDSEHGKLKLLSRTLTDTPDSEPRYCAFHPTKPYLYVNHEHTPGNRLTMATLRYNEQGQVEELSRLYIDASAYPVVDPEYFQMQGMCISPDGRFVYVQAHGHNLILVLKVNEETGLLEQYAETPIEGEWPRSLTLSPDGRFLINCCLAGQITVFAVAEDGTLSDTGHRAFVKGSGYVSFYP